MESPTIPVNFSNEALPLNLPFKKPMHNDVKIKYKAENVLEEELDSHSLVQLDDNNEIRVNHDPEDNNKYLKCNCCPFKTKYKYNLFRHAESHLKNSEMPLKFKCDQCPYEGTRIEYLKKHKNVHSEVKYKCGYCDFATKFKTNLPKHMARHKPASECQMFKCNECPFETKDKCGLKRHKLTHRTLEEVDHFKCTMCGFVTKHQTSYTNHMLKIHHKDKIEKHHCPECNFFTYHKISLKHHILTHRKPGEVPMYKCPECPYETKNKQFLPSHMKTHLSNSPCPICHKMISQRGMPTHLKSHNSEEIKNKYKCKQCTYKTMYFGNMSRHLKIMHSNKKDINYKRCPQCSFKTFENSRLKRHIKEIHSDEAPQYKCDHCEFTSKFNSCLKRHVETAHINTDPVACPVCQKQSANIYTLRIHMKLHKTEEEVKMFQCLECPYRTRHSGAFKGHLKRHSSSKNQSLKDHKNKGLEWDSDESEGDTDPNSNREQSDDKNYCDSLSQVDKVS